MRLPPVSLSPEFQFYNSAINSLDGFEDFFRSLHFNSTIVRLIAIPTASVGTALAFQFYNSAINRLRRRRHPHLPPLYFNSTIVRLIVVTLGLSVIDVEYFNSTIVRLIESEPAAIAASIDNFNSTIVRLIVYL